MTNRETLYDIMDQLWTVRIVDAHDPGLFVDGIACRGATWLSSQQIFLSNELTEHTLKRVLIHELTHAVLYASQIELPEHYSEEQVCDFVAIYSETVLRHSEALEVWAFNEPDKQSD